MQTTTLLKMALIAGVCAAVAGCGNEGDAGGKTAEKTAAAPAKVPEVVIYTNADEEAQVAMKNALDNHGMKGAYLMQSFGTSELGGKLAAEGKNIEADVVTLSTYYLDSFQKKEKLFVDLKNKMKTLQPTPSYWTPILGQMGTLIINTEALKQTKLPEPKSIADLAKPEYAGHIAVPDIMGSSTSWLMTQAVMTAEGEEEGAKTIAAIEKNAGAHLEMSGSGPLKKLRAGEAAVGFGLRHQAVADKARGLPINYIDPTEGNFVLQEAAAIVDKGDKTNPNAQKVVDIIIKYARPDILKYYQVPLYEGEKVSAENVPAHSSLYKETLTVELLQKHQKMVKDAGK